MISSVMMPIILVQELWDNLLVMLISMIFGDGFSSIFAAYSRWIWRWQVVRRSNRGEDLQIELSLSLKEIAEGVEKKIKISTEACDKCDGTGSDDGEWKPPMSVAVRYILFVISLGRCR